MTVNKRKANKNPNVRTRAWGPVAWMTINFIILGYPKTNPSSSKRKLYRNFLIQIGKVLPCNLCRSSYAKFIKEIPLDRSALSGRKNLLFWFFKIHNRVNKKLGCKELTRAQFEKKYKYLEQFRAKSCSPKMAGCTKPLANNKRPKRCKVVVVGDKKKKKRKKRQK